MSVSQKSAQQQIDRLKLEIEEKEHALKKAYKEGLEAGKASAGSGSSSSSGASTSSAETEKLQAEIARLKQQSQAVDRERLTEAVKKVMTQLFFTVREQFDAETQYAGANVVQTVLGAIKQTTTTMLAPPTPQAADKQAADDDDDEVEEVEEVEEVVEEVEEVEEEDDDDDYDE